MILSLSGRMFETSRGVRLSPEAFCELAAEIGYRAVEVRFSQINPDSAPADIDVFARTLSEHGLHCAFLTVPTLQSASDFDVAMRQFDNAVAFKCRYIRAQTALDFSNVGLMQDLCDAAAERDLQIVEQIHDGCATHNVSGALQTINRINRPNHGIAFEASHLHFDGKKPRDGSAVMALRDHILTVSVQAYCPVTDAPDGEVPFQVAGGKWCNCLPGHPGSADLAGVFRALQAIDFDRYVTVMCPALATMDSPDLARYWYDYICRQITDV